MVTLGPSLILLPTIKDTILQESCHKNNALVAFSTHYFEMVFVMLAKVIALQIKISIVQIRVPELK